MHLSLLISLFLITYCYSEWIQQVVSRTRYSPTTVTFVERFHIKHVASATLALICLVTLKLVRIIACGVGKLCISVGVYGTFRSRLMDRHLSDAPRDIATLTLALVGDMSLRDPSVPSLNFVGLLFRKIWHIFSDSNNLPLDLSLLWHDLNMIKKNWS